MQESNHNLLSDNLCPYRNMGCDASKTCLLSNITDLPLLSTSQSKSMTAELPPLLGSKWKSWLSLSDTYCAIPNEADTPVERIPPTEIQFLSLV